MNSSPTYRLPGDLHVNSHNRECSTHHAGEIRGDPVSCGPQSLFDMVEMTKNDIGMEYVAIVQHPTNPVSPHTIDARRAKELLENQQRMDDLQSEGKLKDFHVLIGVEMSIMPNGKLEVPDYILSQLDIVIIARHGGLNEKDPQVIMRDFRSSLESSRVHILSHPTRYVFPLTLDNWREVLTVAKKNNIAVEYNTSWQYDENFIDLIGEVGAMVSLGTDIHPDVDGETGKLTARQHSQLTLGVNRLFIRGIKPGNILNLMSYSDLRSWLAR